MADELPGFTDNLGRLFQGYYWLDPDSGRPVSHTTQSLARELRSRGYKISDSYVHQLLQGKSANPTGLVLAGLSEAFAVSAAYWFDPDVRAAHNTALDRDREALLGPRRGPR